MVFMGVLEVSIDLNDTAERFESYDYHSSAGLSQSGLKLYERDPELYSQGGSIEKTESMRFGSAVDARILGGEAPAKLIPATALNAQGHRKGKAYTDWAATVDNPKEWLTPNDYDRQQRGVDECCQSIRNSGLAARILLEDGENHVRIRWTDKETGLLLRCELDRVNRWNRPAIVDLKTTLDPSAKAFAKQAVNLGYHLQAAWYTEAWLHLTGESLPFLFVAVKNKPSYFVEVHQLSEDFIAIGRRKMRDGLRRFAESSESGNWRTPTSGIVQTVEPPSWAK